jgi:hypothetical protein
MKQYHDAQVPSLLVEVIDLPETKYCRFKLWYPGRICYSLLAVLTSISLLGHQCAQVGNESRLLLPRILPDMTSIPGEFQVRNGFC